MTMLRTWAASTEGAMEADVEAIERSMRVTRTRAPLDRSRNPLVAEVARLQIPALLRGSRIWQFSLYG